MTRSRRHRGEHGGCACGLGTTVLRIRDRAVSKNFTLLKIVGFALSPIRLKLVAHAHPSYPFLLSLAETFLIPFFYTKMTLHALPKTSTPMSPSLWHPNDGPYAWGLCFKEEVNPLLNYNYGPAGKALGFDGLRNPDIVSNNSLIAFKTALWFWMTQQKPKPSCHNVMIGKYVPTEPDMAANRTAGYGLVTNIINGGLECGFPDDARVNFKRYATLFDVHTGPNLDCAYQKSF
ncbi:hypothetical protein RJT34_23139 [Clitoria ternatea]|uniref:Glycoside hydrolase family 19 catalytic domain-containing protein n=1 Tax=Clitoria ternatea TaxID=43366 RepID=A0AAN9FKK7_CLITE